MPVHLSVEARYDQVATAFGGKGALVKNHKDLKDTLTTMLADDNLWVLNVVISTTGARKEQKFSWLTRDDEKKKEDSARL